MKTWAERELGIAGEIGAPPEEHRPDDAVRVSKQGTVYLHVLPDPDGYQTQYQCRDCPMWIGDVERCTIHGPEDVIKPFGTCGYFVRGQPVSSEGHEPMGGVTPLQSGYEENAVGFSCKRCAAYVAMVLENGTLADSGGCQIVDYDSPGDDPGKIHPDACCAAWTKDPEVGELPTDEFPRAQPGAGKPPA